MPDLQKNDSVGISWVMGDWSEVVWLTWEVLPEYEQMTQSRLVPQNRLNWALFGDWTDFVCLGKFTAGLHLHLILTDCYYPLLFTLPAHKNDLPKPSKK